MVGAPAIKELRVMFLAHGVVRRVHAHRGVLDDAEMDWPYDAVVVDLRSTEIERAVQLRETQPTVPIVFVADRLPETEEEADAYVRLRPSVLIANPTSEGDLTKAIYAAVSGSIACGCDQCTSQ